MANQGHQRSEVQYLKFWIENDLMLGEFTDEIVWNMEKAKEAVRIRTSLAEGRDFPTLLDARKVKAITKEAREYLATGEAQENVSAGALLIDSTVSQVMANFYMMINKPIIPFKVFTDRDKALEWLKNFVNE